MVPPAGRPLPGGFLLFLILVCLIQPVTAQVTTIYVDNQTGETACPDYDPAGRSCGSGKFAVFSDIADAARNVHPGTTVLIQPGTYNGGIVVRRGGTEAQPVVFKATGPGVFISGSAEERDAFYISESNHVHVEGLTIENADRAGLRISLSHHVQVRNSVFRDNGTWGIFTDFSDYTLVENCETSGSITQHGIYISNSSDYPVIRGNRIHHNAQAGLHMNGDASMGGDGIVSDALIENNIIYENGRRGASGINLDGVTHSLIRNNLLYENHASGISLYQIDGASHSHSNRVFNNTIVNGRFSRWALNMPSTANNQVLNNILLNQNRFRGSILVGFPVGEGFHSDYNVVMDSFAVEGESSRRLDFNAWRELGFDLNSRIAQLGELFFNWSADDYQLTPGSPAIAAGTPLPEIAADLQGNSRPLNHAPDIGAYQWSP